MQVDSPYSLVSHNYPTAAYDLGDATKDNTLIQRQPQNFNLIGDVTACSAACYHTATGKNDGGKGCSSSCYNPLHAVDCAFEAVLAPARRRRKHSRSKSRKRRSRKSRSRKRARPVHRASLRPRRVGTRGVCRCASNKKRWCRCVKYRLSKGEKWHSMYLTVQSKEGSKTNVRKRLQDIVRKWHGQLVKSKLNCQAFQCHALIQVPSNQIKGFMVDISRAFAWESRQLRGMQPYTFKP